MKYFFIFYLEKIYNLNKATQIQQEKITPYKRNRSLRYNLKKTQSTICKVITQKYVCKFLVSN